MGEVMAMDMEGQSPTAEQAVFEKSDDLAGNSPLVSRSSKTVGFSIRAA
jgi:hypothetical protein